MPARALAGPSLAKLVKKAIGVLRAAQLQCPRTGPGRPPEFPDWKLAALVLAAVLKGRKSKSAQYRFLHEHRRKLKRWLGMKYFPSRTTYFDRYRGLSRLLARAVALQGQSALREGVAVATTVAVDKTCIPARGAPWHRRGGRPCRASSGVDQQAGWGFSEHHGWVYGYGLEVVVTVTAGSLVFPILASVGTANVSERRSFLDKAAQLPGATRHALADCGYDSNEVGEAVERTPEGRPTGRRFVCPLQRRPGNTKVGRSSVRGLRRRLRHRRRARLAFYESPQGRRLYRQRKRIEPFHEWFKERFDLTRQVWHRGLQNNQTQILTAVFAYQLLVRYNCRDGRRNGQIQWILDRL
jgi:hypothetical protein